VQGVSLAFDATGDGPPVVFIGGTGMPRHGWLLTQPKIEASGFRTVVFDGRGVGDSDAPAGPYSIADMAADTAGLIEGLDLSPCHLVGVSQGGVIAEELARRRPELVRSAVLIASAGRASAFERLYARALHQLSLALGPGVPDEIDTVHTLLLMMSSDQLQDDELVTLWAELSRGRTWSGPGRMGQQRANLDWRLDKEWETLWAQVRRPVLVIAFEHDILFPPPTCREAAAAMADAEYLEIKGAGHGGVALKSDEVAEALVEFLHRH
jgi:pimeloyl-ACP methyl ester carboxylesterase